MNVEKLQQIEKDLGFDLTLLIEILNKQKIYTKTVYPNGQIEIFDWDSVVVDLKRKMILYSDVGCHEPIEDYIEKPLLEYGKTWAATLEELVVEGEKNEYVK